MHTLIGLFPMNDTPDDSFKPLSHNQFFRFFLVPHVAATLIAQDLGTTLTNGHKCMLKTSNVGELQYPQAEDDELDDIYHTNIILFKKFGWKRANHDSDPANQSQSVPTRKDVEDVARLLLRLRHEPDPDQVRTHVSSHLIDLPVIYESK